MVLEDLEDSIRLQLQRQGVRLGHRLQAVAVAGQHRRSAHRAVGRDVTEHPAATREVDLAVQEHVQGRDRLPLAQRHDGLEPCSQRTELSAQGLAGFDHLAFRVDDIEAETKHLLANGVKLLSDEMDYISWRLRLFEGPEGVTFELVQWVDSVVPPA